MNEREALVYIKRLIKTASDLNDIEAVSDQLHTILPIANRALLPAQHKPGKK
ncbi:hypothetical protein [Nitrobacter sp. JJSN]|uniref:hypothetical protein n=1 Tax=Nitrobacter sp. JJSN TaxID=3453033 RepID=UPI003F76B4B6